MRCFSDVGRYSVGISKSHREYEVRGDEKILIKKVRKEKEEDF